MRILSLSLSLGAALLLGACAPTPTLEPEASAEFAGLNPVSGSGFDEAWARPGTDLGAFRAVRITPLRTADAEIVQPNTSSAYTRIQREWKFTPERQQTLATAWDTAIRRAAEQRGLGVNSEGERAVRIDASMTRLAPGADFAGTQTATANVAVYTEYSGQASMEFRLYDADSGTLLAVIRDSRKLGADLWRRSGTVSAGADARSAMNTWANRLVGKIGDN